MLIIITIIIIIKACWQFRFYLFSLAIHPCQSSLLVSPLDNFSYWLRADKCKFLLLGQHWSVHVLEFIRVCHLWVCPYFTCSTPHVFFVLLGWFLRWEVDGHTVSVLYVAISRICSEQQATFLCDSHLAFSLGVLLKPTCCNYMVVFIRL